jgi:hypothetical protein
MFIFLFSRKSHKKERSDTPIMMNHTFRTSPSLLLRLLFLLLVLALPVALIAQGTSATVTGFVSDVSGAKVPAATVTFTNTETGVAGAATTNGVWL